MGIGVMLFAVHPLRAEAVGWLSCQVSEGRERSELSNASLCNKSTPFTRRFAPRLTLFAIRFAHCALQPYLLATAFALGSLIMYLKKRTRTSQILYVLSVLSKTILVPLPAVLVLFDVFGKRRKKNRPLTFGVIVGRGLKSLYKNVAYFLVALVIAVKTIQANDFGSRRGSERRKRAALCYSIYDKLTPPLRRFSHRSTSTLTPFQQVLKFLHTIFFYFSKTTLPTRISGFYPLVEEDYRSLNWEVFLGCLFSLCVLVLLILMLFVFAGKNSSRFLILFGGIYGACIAPTLVTQHGWPMVGGNRYSYLPSALLAGGWVAVVALETKQANPGVRWKVSGECSGDGEGNGGGECSESREGALWLTLLLILSLIAAKHTPHSDFTFGSPRGLLFLRTQDAAQCLGQQRRILEAEREAARQSKGGRWGDAPRQPCEGAPQGGRYRRGVPGNEGWGGEEGDGERGHDVRGSLRAGDNLLRFRA